MARIGKQIPHFEWIDTGSADAVFSSDKRYRYRLTMQFRDSLVDTGRHASLTVILKNPSAADHSMADATIRKVETFVYSRFSDVRTLHILNIFAFRATDPGDLNQAFMEKGALEVIGSENDHVIGKTLEESDYLIIAWGNRSGIDEGLYEERVQMIKRLIDVFPSHKSFTVRGNQETIHPLHGLMWGYDYEIVPAEMFLKKQ
jgi:hypothetical protein